MTDFLPAMCTGLLSCHCQLLVLSCIGFRVCAGVTLLGQELMQNHFIHMLLYDITCLNRDIGSMMLQGGQRRGLDLDDDLDLGPEPSSLVTVAPGAAGHPGGTQAAAGGRIPPGGFAHPGGAFGAAGNTVNSCSAFWRYHINGYVDPVELLGLEVFAAVAPAVPEAVAGGVLQLWRHMHRLPGAAPSEALLQVMAATTAAAVAAGEWLLVLWCCGTNSVACC